MTSPELPDNTLFDVTERVSSGTTEAIEQPETSILPPIERVVAVDLSERNLYLQAALRSISEVSRYDGFLKASAVHSYYGRNLPSVIAGAERNRETIRQRAISYFGRAYGIDILISSGTQSDTAAMAEAKKSFKEFYMKYGRVENAEARDAEIDRLFKPEKMAAQTARQGLRERKISPDWSEERLSHYDKMLAILEDPRAGYIATHHKEKTTALYLLDYVDNPEFPRQTVNQLEEIFVHQQKPVSKGKFSAGMKVVRSKTFEMGDYLINAVLSAEKLRSLAEAVSEEPNPFISLAEAVGLDHPGLPPLVRYLDLRYFIDNAKMPVTGFNIFHPIRTEDQPPESPRNKTLEDYYTAKVPLPKVAAYIADRATSLKIGELRRKNVFEFAIQDQERRALFWEAREVETQARSVATDAGRIVLEALKRVKFGYGYLPKTS